MNNFVLIIELIGAIYSSIFGGKVQQPYVPMCRTGNCTWPEYTSVAVCSGCQEVPELWNYAVQYTAFASWKNDKFNVSSLPGLQVDWDNIIYTSPILYIAPTMSTVLPKNTSSTIIDFTSFEWAPGAYGASNIQNNTWYDDSFRSGGPIVSQTPPSGIFECRLYFCVQTFGSRTINGVYQENVTARWPDVHNGGPNEVIDITEPDFIGHLKREEIISANLSIPSSDSTSQLNISLLTSELLAAWAQQAFTGTMTLTSMLDCPDPCNSTSNSRLTGVRTYHGGYIADGTDEGSVDMIKVFYEEQTSTPGTNRTIGNFTVPTTQGPGPLVKRIARGMTARIRSVGDPQRFATSDVLAIELYVEARWLWALLPTTLLLLTMILLTSTVVVTHRTGMQYGRVPALQRSYMALMTLRAATSEARSRKRWKS